MFRDHNKTLDAVSNCRSLQQQETFDKETSYSKQGGGVRDEDTNDFGQRLTDGENNRSSLVVINANQIQSSIWGTSNKNKIFPGVF